MSEAMKFDFNEVDDFKGRIEPGVEECQITGLLQDKSANDKEYIEVGFISLDKQREHKERFFVSSEKGIKMTMLRLKHVIKTLLGEAKAKGSYTFDGLNQLMTGLKGRFLFFGEEYEYNGEIRVRTNLAFLNFVEALTVSSTESRLRYDPNNKNHLKLLPKEVKNAINGNEETTPTIENNVF